MCACLSSTRSAAFCYCCCCYCRRHRERAVPANGLHGWTSLKVEPESAESAPPRYAPQVRWAVFLGCDTGSDAADTMPWTLGSKFRLFSLRLLEPHKLAAPPRVCVPYTHTGAEHASNIRTAMDTLGFMGSRVDLNISGEGSACWWRSCVNNTVYPTCSPMRPVC